MNYPAIAVISIFVCVALFSSYLMVTGTPKEIRIVRKSCANSNINYLKNMEKAKIISVDMDDDPDGYVKITFSR